QAENGGSFPEVTPVAPAAANQDVVPFEGPIPLAPPDGQWLTDEYGRKYFVHRIKKVPGAYFWEVQDKRVKLPRGLMFDVVSHDDTSFSVKIYGTDAQMAAAIEQSRKAATPPTPEELAKVAASYQPDVTTSDRLVFAPFSQGLPQTGQWRQGFDVADINRDGKLDIVHGPPRKGGSTPAIFLGDGKGTWRRWTAARFPAIPFDYGDAAVADLNRDGHPDLVIASHLRGITAMIGDGKGGFTPWSQGIEFEAGDQETPIFSSRAVEMVDWNGDGLTDILAFGEGPRLAATQRGVRGDFSRGSRGAMIYLNQGDGTWQKKTQEERIYGDEVEVVDFNGDGRPDFLASSAVVGSRTILFQGQEDGSWKGVPIEQLRPHATFRAVAAGDFDRDGRQDLAVGYSNRELDVTRTGIDVLLARPDGTWERRGLGVEEISAGIWALDAGDLDGDGALDLVGITGRGDSWVFLGDGKGSFSREESPEIGLEKADCTGFHVRLEDLDGDGAAEVIGGYAGEGSALFGVARCESGGSLRVWKASRQGRR
ncbi:MAG TPA: VCBS repeat-containing protein, partial [Thermoanaerobaculia bacterium]|nr:VCBS repeat-containing protein [Thermoanaerobaculia bacterium]